MDVKKLLRALCEAPGVAGEENSAREAAQGFLSKLGECSVTPLGSLICRVLPPKKNGAHLMLDAHIDEIGLIVTAVLDDGFLKVAACGGMDRRSLSASQMTVHTKTPRKGVICSVPPHLQSAEEEKKLPKIEDFALDVGLSGEVANKEILIGTRVTPDISYCEMPNGFVSSRALDNRAGCAAVILAAQLIKKAGADCGLSVVLSSMEEVGGQGAATAAYELAPTHAIAVDVSFGHCPGVPKHRTAALGSGPMIGVSPILSGEMGQKLAAEAKKEKIPHTFEAMGSRTGTNADNIAATRAGVKTALLSVPQRNMHSPVEMVKIADIEDTARLIAAYVKSAF